MTEEALAPTPSEAPQDVQAAEATEAPEGDQEQASEGDASDPKPKRSKSAREAVERAFSGGSQTEPTAEEKAAAEAKAEADKAKTEDPPKKAEAKTKPEDKPETKTATEAPKKAESKADATQAEKPAPHAEAPKRFSSDAKGEWEKAPESVRAEAHRAVRELEKGLQQKDAVLKPLQPYIEQAEQSGTTIHEALGRYIQMETALRQNPAQGLRALAQNMGMTPQQMASLLTQGQPGQADPRDAQILGLQRQIQQMQQQFGQVSQTIEQQRHNAVLDQIQQFAADKPRFDELAPEIARMIETGYATDLSDAYEKADRQNPAPASAPEPIPAPPAQTRQARSLTGAPNPGSTPATKRARSNSPREALAKAFRV